MKNSFFTSLKKILLLMLSMITSLWTCACGSDGGSSYGELDLLEQTPQQLDIEPENDGSSHSYTPLNYTLQKAVWFTMMDWNELLKNDTQEEFTHNISALLEKIKETGFNTVYLHIRPYNAAYYRSELFPLTTLMTGEYDCLKLTLDKAHELGLSVHGWINPLRCGNDMEMEEMDSSYTVKKWYDDKADSYICKVGDRWYLNPAYEDVREFIAEGVGEIVENYDVDGIHIDDYFYPTTGEEFDSEAFEQSESSDLTAWRIDNIDRMVQGMYEKIKGMDKNVLFGISPQGNMKIDHDTLYADVEKWCSNNGYCDYIAPQLYYGFKNESMPFEPTLDNWLETAVAVKPVAGICTYKIGKEDKWAGSGIDEWVNDSHIPSREGKMVLEKGCSLAVYSVGSLFDDEQQEELTMLREVLTQEDEE